MTEFEISEEFVEQLTANLENPEKLREITADLRAEDMAEILEKRFSGEEKVILFRAMPPEEAAEVAVLVNDELRELFFQEMKPDQTAIIVQEMESDDAADFLGSIPDEDSQSILAHLPVKDSAEVKNLLQYPEESAGGIMQVELIALSESQTCGDAIRLIRSMADEVPELHNVFVTDENGKLSGIVPLHKLILNPKETIIRDVMEEAPLSVDVTADREEVAQIFRKYDLVSLPAVDGEGKLLGRIMHDDVLDVITEESTEDMLKTAGTDEQELESVSWVQAARYRLPWLLSSLVGGVIIAGIISRMGTMLEQVVAIAAFIPIVTGMGGNVSTQSSAIIVRAIVLGKINERNISSHFQKEISVSLAVASFCGSLVGIVAWGLEQNSGLGFVVGISLFCSMFVAALLGTFIPLALKWLKADPVLGGGPLVLTLMDLIGLSIYFSIARLLLKFML